MRLWARHEPHPQANAQNLLKQGTLQKGTHHANTGPQQTWIPHFQFSAASRIKRWAGTGQELGADPNGNERQRPLDGARVSQLRLLPGLQFRHRTHGVLLWKKLKRAWKALEEARLEDSKGTICLGAEVYGSASSAPEIWAFSPRGFHTARNRNCWVTGQDEWTAASPRF